MRRAALLLAHLHRHDAIANDTRGLQRSLEGLGYEALIFAPSADPGLDFHHIKDYPGFIKHRDDLIVLAYGGWWPKGEEVFTNSPARKILRYHNITPGHFYAPYDPTTAQLCDSGRSNLEGFISRSQPDLVLADSSYNARDVQNCGLTRGQIQILPVFHQIDELLSVPEPADGIAKYLTSRENLLVLMVGRVVPNKAWLHYLECAAHYRKYINTNCLFVIAGSVSVRMGSYYRELELFIQNHQLQSSIVHLRDLNAADLHGLYTQADAMLCCSEHEGFCVPLVEALAHQCPVVCLNRGASAETVGEAALVFQQYDPLTLACALEKIHKDQRLRNYLKQTGYQRYLEVFDNHKTEQKFRELWQKHIAKAAPQFT